VKDRTQLWHTYTVLKIPHARAHFLIICYANIRFFSQIFQIKKTGKPTPTLAQHVLDLLNFINTKILKIELSVDFELGRFLSCLKETFRTLKNGERFLGSKLDLIIIFVAFVLCIAHFVCDFVKHFGGKKNRVEV